MRNPETSRRFIKEKVIPLALTITSACSSGTKPVEQRPFMPPGQGKMLFMSQEVQREDIKKHPVIALLEKSTKQELGLVGLTEKDKSDIAAGLMEHAAKRTYPDGKTEIVFFTNTNILDNGFRLWVRYFLSQKSIFSPQDIQTATTRLLSELRARFGLSATTVSSKKDANCDMHITDIKGKNTGQKTAGQHQIPSGLVKKTHFGAFEDITDTYAWANLHDYRDAGDRYTNIPIPVIKDFGIDIMVKSAIHELSTHKILGANHIAKQDDISNENIFANLKSSDDPAIIRKPWSHIYKDTDGNEYVANFSDGNPLDDQTNKVVRFHRFVRLKERGLTLKSGKYKKRI